MDKLSFGKKHQIKSLINQETGEKYSLNEAVKKFYEEKILGVKSKAVAKASTTRDMIVRRGDDYNMLEELGVDFSKANLENIKGSPLTAKAFFSASPDPPHGGFDKSIEYIVKVSKGSQAMYVDSISINEGEKELLINRGGRYILEDVEYYDDNKTPKKIYMTLINLQNKA